MTYRIIKGLIRTLIILRRINWVQFFRLKDKNSEIVLWIPSKGLNYFLGDAFIWDTATINSFIKNNIKFRIFYGNGVGKLTGKKIFHTINRGVNIYKFSNYADYYYHLIKQLESQGNKMFPSSSEVVFWENKGFMHKQFKRLNVSEPNTQLYTFEEIDKLTSLEFPFLIKAEHACSANGVFKIKDMDDFVKLISSEAFRVENELVIKQELINMRRDLRVILVGDEIVHFYWRINKSKEWKPTSTSFGSEVDFGNFPEQWRTHILETFQKLNITTGAFDVTWQNDDLNNLPLYLEISPVFQPNPQIELNGKEYAYYKKSYSPFNTYDNKFVDLVFRIKQKQIDFIQKKYQI